MVNLDALEQLINRGATPGERDAAKLAWEKHAGRPYVGPESREKPAYDAWVEAQRQRAKDQQESDYDPRDGESSNRPVWGVHDWTAFLAYVQERGFQIMDVTISQQSRWRKHDGADGRAYYSRNNGPMEATITITVSR